MVTNKFIKSYAVINSKWVSKNLLDVYLKFVMTIIKEESIEHIEENFLCEKIFEKYGIRLQPTLIRQVLSHAMSKKLVKKVREKYVVTADNIDQFVIPENDFNKSWDELVDDFMLYCNKHNIKFESETVKSCILEFIDSYDDHVVYNSIGDIETEENRFVYFWCRYIIEIRSSDVQKYEFVLALCTANLLKNTLFYTGQGLTNTCTLKVYLDTPMIFALLGMDTPERAMSYRYILEKAKIAGMELCVFDHNFEETTGIMERASYWALNNNYDPSKANKVAEFFHDSGMEQEEIQDFIDNTETTLNSLGVVQVKSAYVAEENGFQEDETKIHEMIKTEYGNRSSKFVSEDLYDNSIRTDVRSLVMVQRKRAGGYSADLKNSRHLFITTNNVVAKVSKDYTANDELTKDKIPTCITADIFGTLLWLEFPEQQESYLSLKLLADCKALLRPTAQMIAQFNIKLDEAYKRGESDLTEEKFLFLRSHPIVREKLLDITTGDYSQFTDNTWREVYNAIESQAKFHGEQKYEKEKEEHLKTKTELDEAKNVISKQDDTINDLNIKIDQRDEKYSSIIASIISGLVFGIPYITIVIILAILQNKYMGFTVKGFVIGGFTIITTLLAGALYGKLQLYVKNRLYKKFRE